MKESLPPSSRRVGPWGGRQIPGDRRRRRNKEAVGVKRRNLFTETLIPIFNYTVCNGTLWQVQNRFVAQFLTSVGHSKAMIFPLSSVLCWPTVGWSWKTENSLWHREHRLYTCVWICLSENRKSGLGLTRFVHICTISLSVCSDICESERGIPSCFKKEQW